MDAGLVGIVEAGDPQQLATGFEFTEGPLWSPDGHWLFVDIRTSRIYKLAPGGEPEVVRENSDQSNGMTYDMQGRVLVCEMTGRQVQRWESDGSFTPVATHWDGKRLNRPNDVICASDGSIYFTDPGIRMEEHEKELDFFGVYRVSPDGDLQPVITDFDFPNGLALSPDERTLYVANSRPDMHIRAFDRQADGTVANGRVFAELRARGAGGRAGRHEGGRRGPRVLDRARRLLGLQPRRGAPRHHRAAGGPGQLRVRRG